MKEYVKLGKLSIILPVGFTAFTGYFLCKPVIDLHTVGVVLGVILLGSSASALNQVQERYTDAMMDRTRNRPLPVRSVSPGAALFFSLISLIAGIALLLVFGSPLAMALGLFTIAWYNGLYTYLKRVTAFAAVPGAITGAMPPLIGWTAAGGQLTDSTSLTLAFLLFIGQVPHFWLLTLRYGEEYQNAGLPSLTSMFSRKQIASITFAWIAASLFTALSLATLGILHTPVTRVILLILTLGSLSVFSGLPRNIPSTPVRNTYFILLNSFFMVVMVILIIDKMLP